MFQQDCKSVGAWLGAAWSNSITSSTDLRTGSSLLQGFQGTVLFWQGRCRLPVPSQHIKPLEAQQKPGKRGQQTRAPQSPQRAGSTQSLSMPRAPAATYACGFFQQRKPNLINPTVPSGA